MIPERSLIDLQGSFVEQQNRRTRPLIDYERGGLVLNSSNDNLQEVMWTAECIDNTVYVYRDGVERVAVLTDVGITQIALAFDQTMRPHIAYMSEGVCKFYWFDTQINDMRTTVFADATTPRLCMDEKRPYYTSRSDVLLSYKKGMDLVVRVQRERFQIEHVIDTNIPGDLISVGMNNKNRLQWFCVGDRYTPPGEESKPVSLVGSGPTVIRSGDPTITLSPPTGIAVGDLLVVTLMHRSSLTLPSGWSLFGQTPINSNDGVNQQTSIAFKRVVAADLESGLSYQFAQSSGARFIGVIAAYRSEFGPTLKGPFYAPNGTSTSQETITLPLGTITTLYPQCMIHVGASWVNYSTGPNSIVPNTAVRLDDTSITTDTRLLAAAYLQTDAGPVPALSAKGGPNSASSGFPSMIVGFVQGTKN